MNKFFRVIAALLLILCGVTTLMAAPLPIRRIDAPQLSERWFGIYVNGDRVGFYRQRFDKDGDGFRLEGNGSVRMKVMGFSKEASMRETYLVAKNLTLRSFDIDQTVNGSTSHVSGAVSGAAINLKSTVNGVTSGKTLKFRGEVYPPPALNLYPLMRPSVAGSTFTVQEFDPEELKIKEVRISVLGEGKTSDGLPAIKLRNDLYPFVTNDIWVDTEGNTVEESVREGLVTTKAEPPETLGSFIGDWALAKQDLIYDFSLVREQPPLKEPKKLSGLAVVISGWNDALPLLQGGGQSVENQGGGRVIFRTGSRAHAPAPSAERKPTEADLKGADRIESEAPEIANQAQLLVAGIKNRKEQAGILAAWTANRLSDTIDDGGGALESLKSMKGNCQTHARLYTALARSAGIPTRFVSGLVHLEGKGFLYHSWAESFLGEHWVSVDPTYNQLPADPTHLKLLEGHLPENMTPIIAIIGRIRMEILETTH
jgi:hypothetical protein